MRLPLKFALSLLPGIVVVLGAHTMLRLKREATFFEMDMAHDAAMLSRVVAESIMQLYPDGGPRRVETWIQRLNDQSRLVKLRWLDARDATAQARLAELPEPARQQLASDGFASYQMGSRYFPGLFLAYRRVNGEHGPLGVVLVEESPETERRYLLRTIRNLVLVTASSSLLCAVLALALGVVIVGRPMRALVERARRIGAGYFSGQLEIQQHDELGELASEINTMSRRLAESRERLASEMAARMAATDQLRHADRLMTVGRLASGIAHELGTPLNIVSGRARMIEDGEVEGADLKKNAHIIGEQSDRMARIIRQLLDFARQRGAQKGRTDIAKLLSQVAELLRPMAEKSSVRMIIDPGPSEAFAEVDANQLSQALTNITVNAIQAMPLGGQLTLQLRHEPASSVTGPRKSRGNHWAITIRDQGAGMEEDVLAHLFEPFFTTKDVGQGTGLGLAVTHGIVEDHGGWIDVQSQAGKGSEFVIHLPEQQPQGSGVAEMDPPREVRS
jgi:two-component system NtrC family sensor kinase